MSEPLAWLQTRWAITQGAVRYWKKKRSLQNYENMLTLHNMITKIEGGDVERWRPPSDEVVSHPEYARDPELLVAHISSRLDRIRNRGTNSRLKI